MRYLARRKLRKLIAYHTRMKETQLFIRKQYPVLDVYSVHLSEKAMWHDRYITRLVKLLEKYL